MSASIRMHFVRSFKKLANISTSLGLNTWKPSARPVIIYHKTHLQAFRCSSSVSDDDEAVKATAKKNTPQLSTPGKELKSGDVAAGSDSDSSSSSDSSGDDESSSDEEGLDPKLVSAIDSVAKSVQGNEQETKSELLKKLQEHVLLTESQKDGKLPQNISSLISGLKVQSSRDRFVPKQQRDDRERRPYKGRPDRQTNRGKGDPKDSVLDNIKLLDSPPLGIFTTREPAVTEKAVPSLFDKIEEEELQHKIDLPPVNAFMEMVKWTNEGKLWHYPISNEQGLEQEAQVGFHEHVFLDHHLNDFPKRGPVRHFVELVITGLSKNAYLTAAQKNDHINWYKEYFKDKYELIDELTITADKKQEEINQ